MSGFTRLRLDRIEHIVELVFNRPAELNVMDEVCFSEIGKAFEQIDSDEQCRVAIIRAEGKLFTAGLDLKSSSSILMGEDTGSSKAVKNLALYKRVLGIQKNLASIRKCRKPVIVCVHSKCIGGGVDLACWCDIRLATRDASFSIKETQIAIVADLGTLQRIEKLTSSGFAREMAFTGSSVTAERAMRFGFVNEVYETKESMLEGARAMAKTISSNSPLVVQSVKKVLNYAEEHDTKDALNHVAMWNAAFLESEDLVEAISGFLQKTTPVFRNKL